jgi:hypothetical protein
MTEFAMLMSTMEAAEHVRATVSANVDATKVSTAKMSAAETTSASKRCIGNWGSTESGENKHYQYLARHSLTEHEKSPLRLRIRSPALRQPQDWRCGQLDALMWASIREHELLIEGSWWSVAIIAERGAGRGHSGRAGWGGQRRDGDDGEQCKSGDKLLHDRSPSSLRMIRTFVFRLLTFRISRRSALSRNCFAFVSLAQKLRRTVLDMSVDAQSTQLKRRRRCSRTAFPSYKNFNIGNRSSDQWQISRWHYPVSRTLKL